MRKSLREHANAEVREWAGRAQPRQLSVLYKCGLRATTFRSGFRSGMMRPTVTRGELEFEIARQVDLNNLHAKRIYVG